MRSDFGKTDALCIFCLTTRGGQTLIILTCPTFRNELFSSALAICVQKKDENIPVLFYMYAHNGVFPVFLPLLTFCSFCNIFFICSLIYIISSSTSLDLDLGFFFGWFGLDVLDTLV